ncbi:large ribosomal subunit protein uL23 [Nicotiana tabacum]|uniref:Large ribosomal subunit protein uL23 n=1 Tax=Nicotiana tabacum TaxID=4097 RepID=A0A1S4DM23_TOBAC|nr:60S ribosomal protein L23a-like [Nicotiana tomentosiformis]
MAAAIASPAAIVRSGRRQDQTFRSLVSIIRAPSSFAVVPFQVSSSSIKLCSFLDYSRLTNDGLLTSFNAKGPHLLQRPLCSVSGEIEGCKERDAKKHRLEYAMEVKSGESTSRHVLYIQNSVSSGRKKILRKERNPKNLNSSASRKNRVEYFQVIRYPLITESTMGNILRHNTLVFVVHEDADKKSIRDAVKKLFKIEMKKINTSIMPDGTKKAYVVLIPNHSAIDVAKKIKAI